MVKILNVYSVFKIKLWACFFFFFFGLIQCSVWRSKWQSTPVFLPGKFHEQRSLGSYSPWGHKGLDTTEWLNTMFCWLYHLSHLISLYVLWFLTNSSFSMELYPWREFFWACRVPSGWFVLTLGFFYTKQINWIQNVGLLKLEHHY